MITWIITGGIGCGKSMLCGFFAREAERVVVFDSDECVHRLLTTGSIVRRLVEAFGGEIVGGDGEIIRSELRRFVFSDTANRRTVERIVHPAVYDDLRRSISDARTNGGVDLFIADIPLYFETKPADLKSDQVLVVAASRGVQVERIVARSKGSIDPIFAGQIVDAQLPVSLKVERGDRAIWNDGSKDSFRRQAGRLLALRKAG
ncbi:MAG: dephospho-CoA kinase [Verrucomicrobiales bacterium]|nr:dephospho-CoA kinase [Verrucomicrobiales bacterium]